MIDYSSFSRYTVDIDGNILNKKSGRKYPSSRVIRLVDDSGERRLVTTKRFIYSRLYGKLIPGDIVVGDFPDLRIKRGGKSFVDDVTISAIKRRQEKGYPASVTARDMMLSLKTIEEIYGKNI